MDRKIRIGIVGYGNLGRGAHIAVSKQKDMQLVGIFSRRKLNIDALAIPAKIYATEDLDSMKEEIDVLILCGGSATDLPTMSPHFANKFNIVDSFDTHAKITEHFAVVNESAQKGKKTAIISIGWDPGLFSLNRLLAEAVIEGQLYTFWGKGVSQGHSEALRSISGVRDAKQYTIPVAKALEEVRSGAQPELSTREKHKRECFVVLEEGADENRVKNTIISMPDYFVDYDTTVHFITEDELCDNHQGLPHGGHVIHSGKTGLDNANNATIEFSLSLDSNPEFTSSVLVAYARAAYRMNQEHKTGCMTIYDVPPYYIHPDSREELLKTIL